MDSRYVVNCTDDLRHGDFYGFVCFRAVSISLNMEATLFLYSLSVRIGRDIGLLRRTQGLITISVGGSRSVSRRISGHGSVALCYGIIVTICTATREE